MSASQSGPGIAIERNWILVVQDIAKPVLERRRQGHILHQGDWHGHGGAACKIKRGAIGSVRNISIGQEYGGSNVAERFEEFCNILADRLRCVWVFVLMMTAKVLLVAVYDMAVLAVGRKLVLPSFSAMPTSPS